MNPIPTLLEHPEEQKIIENRIRFFAQEFGFQEKSLREWLFVQTLLSACWAEEDDNHELTAYCIAFAQLLNIN